jgi:hypothetical protein
MGGGPFPPGAGPDRKELVASLVTVLDDDDSDVRNLAAITLARLGRQSVGPLVEIVKDKDKGTKLRANAAYVLGNIGPAASEAIPALTRALKEKNTDLRKRAVFALARIVADDNNRYGGFPGGFGGGPPMGVGSTGKVPDPGIVGGKKSREEEK